jgi:hypothetical protein
LVQRDGYPKFIWRVSSEAEQFEWIWCNETDIQNLYGGYPQKLSNLSGFGATRWISKIYLEDILRS